MESVEKLLRTDFLAMAIYVELKNNFYTNFSNLTESLYMKYPNYFREHKDEDSIGGTIRYVVYSNSRDSSAYNTIKDRNIFKSVFGKGDGVWDNNSSWNLDMLNFNILLDNISNSNLLSFEEKKLVNYYSGSKRESLILKLYDKYFL